MYAIVGLLQVSNKFVVLGMSSKYANVPFA